ncbi:PREDICTED: putative uncharacterized protein DDB_G0282499 [Trachymyrmex cornetzi]|uniref:WW domain-containing protein n=1 Tax=Trachymyrmex cornetzi TaxID=471704 RepID=A0A151J5I2_9HYME|nr:PREDICTED: putative uncharacterized protein DDB_G0282499 [Trachymyrmex cornetzi]KYN18374.1 hypothetical protein ALC57_09315 [Trachymyrmex cornetzi]
MYSAMYISNFDSDEENYPYYDSGVGYDNNNSSSSSSTQNSQSPRVYEFGKFEENYGWIQCQSKSFPNRVYYHNTRTGCNTWYRPVSHIMDIPFVSVRRVNYTDDTAESTNDLELMSVSDDEKEKQIFARDGNKSLIDAMDIMARYYYTPQIPDADDDSSNVTDGSDCYKEKNQYIDDENNNINDSPLYAMNFLENEFFEDTEEKTNQILEEKTNHILDSLSDNTSDISSFPTEPVMYGVPRLKKIDVECQLIKPKRTYVTSSRKKPGPKKIVSDMYGIRTISYNLPEPNEVCAAMGVKISTLSDSDSDASILSSPSRRTKTTLPFESEWRDIEKNLHQPLLSDSSSSSSSRSDTTSSSSSSSSSSNQNSDSSSSSSSCSCSSCDRSA